MGRAKSLSFVWLQTQSSARGKRSRMHGQYRVYCLLYSDIMLPSTPSLERARYALPSYQLVSACIPAWLQSSLRELPPAVSYANTSTLQHCWYAELAYCDPTINNRQLSQAAVDCSLTFMYEIHRTLSAMWDFFFLMPAVRLDPIASGKDHQGKSHHITVSPRNHFCL